MGGKVEQYWSRSKLLDAFRVGRDAMAVDTSSWAAVQSERCLGASSMGRMTEGFVWVAGKPVETAQSCCSKVLGTKTLESLSMFRPWLRSTSALHERKENVDVN